MGHADLLRFKGRPGRGGVGPWGTGLSPAAPAALRPGQGPVGKSGLGSDSSPLRVLALVLVTLLITGLSACAQYGPRGVTPGTPEAAVIERMGPPTSEYPLPDGLRRLEYARGPFGLHTYMIDVGRDARVLAVEQVLDEAHFNRVHRGLARDDLLRLLGRPTQVVEARADQSWWYWRFDDIFCRWYTVTIDAAGTVVETSYVPDPRCEDPFDFDDR